MPYNGGERGALLVTLFLVLVSMFLAVVNSSPKAKALTSIEAWLIACMAFVFLVLVEYGIMLHIIARRVDKKVKINPE